MEKRLNHARVTWIAILGYALLCGIAWSLELM